MFIFTCFEGKYKGILRIKETLKDTNGAIITYVAHCVIADSLIALHISQFFQKAFSWVKQSQSQEVRTEDIFTNIALKDCIGDILS